MPADFVQELRADREAIREAHKHNQGEKQEGVENTELIGQILGRAADDVQELDAIMNNKYARQPEKLAPHSGRRNQRRAAPHPRPGEIPDSEG